VASLPLPEYFLGLIRPPLPINDRVQVAVERCPLRLPFAIEPLAPQMRDALGAKILSDRSSRLPSGSQHQTLPSSGESLLPTLAKNIKIRVQTENPTATPHENADTHIPIIILLLL
jgi:hypothetical protein